MSNDLLNSNRLLIEAELQPIQGKRFQPTGFPDLGAAAFQVNESKSPSVECTYLLVESAQSMANRLEEVCLNEEKTDFVDELQGLTMIKVEDEHKRQITNSVRESHRIGSFYILEGGSNEIEKRLKELKTSGDNYDTSITNVAPLIFELDINSLIHGVWIAKKIAQGRIKIPRTLSAFIEAKNVKSVISGGVKFDHVEPGKNNDSGAGKGQGNIPFSRIEYTAESITAFFNLDLSQIQSYNLGKEETELLINLALWKIQKFLDNGLRLRTACDLQIMGKPKVISPEGFVIPSISELDEKIKHLISKCDKLGNSVTIKYKNKKNSK